MKLNKLKPLAWGVMLGMGLLAGPALARANSSQTPASQNTHVLRATLDNGLRVVIVRDTLAPMVTTQITYLAGSYEAPKGFPGTAHALEHMMFRDSTGLTGAQLNEMT
ncbi:MAG TPA: insulinase family protein, partial [Rhodanobacteraceae bacterium]